MKNRKVANKGKALFNFKGLFKPFVGGEYVTEKGDSIRALGSEDSAIKNSNKEHIASGNDDKFAQAWSFADIPNKYLYKKNDTLYQPNNLGSISLGDLELNEEVMSEYGTLDLKDIIGKEQTLIIPTKIKTLNKSELFVSELPKGWGNCKSFKVKEK